MYSSLDMKIQDYIRKLPSYPGLPQDHDTDQQKWQQKNERLNLKIRVRISQHLRFKSNVRFWYVRIELFRLNVLVKSFWFKCSLFAQLAFQLIDMKRAKNNTDIFTREAMTTIKGHRYKNTLFDVKWFPYFDIIRSHLSCTVLHT